MLREAAPEHLDTSAIGFARVTQARLELPGIPRHSTQPGNGCAIFQPETGAEEAEGAWLEQRVSDDDLRFPGFAFSPTSAAG
jgi:hypothetical protein